MKIATWLGWALLPVSLLCAQTEQRQSLGIAAVETTPALRQAAEKGGSLNSLERLTQGLDAQLTDAFQQTLKFQLVARSDLAPIMKEQGLSASGNLAPDGQAKLYALAGAKYLLVVILDDFQDRREQGNFELSDMVVRRLILRAGAVAKIYETSTGKLVTSAPVSSEATDVEREFNEVKQSEPMSDRLIARTARALAEAVAAKTTDAVYPARVLAKTGQQITINRGEASGISAGQIWIVCAQGETLVDPDTKEVLGKQEVPVGKARITSVLPKYAIAELVEDFGVQPLQIAYPQK